MVFNIIDVIANPIPLKFKNKKSGEATFCYVFTVLILSIKGNKDKTEGCHGKFSN